ncbi:hypothetical protein RMATCC62417_05547 [Rhizopus microsporus]|nr:hypothetical protein RMATCC62417_05547 [Rhizopus microsporus]
MTDANLQAYITTVFQCTSRRHESTAPIEEWWKLLPIINEHENYYILTAEEIVALETYCINNLEVEMTPLEFVKLLDLVRYSDSEIEEDEIEITPQMSISSSLRPKHINYFDDADSVHHPEPFDEIMDNNNNRTRIPYNTPIQQQVEEIRKLKQEKTSLLAQLKENDVKIQKMAKEHLERITQLETKIQYLNLEKEKQKSVTNEHAKKERERLNKIAELQDTIKKTEEKYTACSKKLSKKEEETTKLQERLRQADKETNQIKELRTTISDLRQELEAHQHENVKLMEIIDKQKFDLDEARSGLNHFYNKDQAELEAEYVERLTQMKKERDMLLQQIEQHQASISDLSNQLDHQHQVVSDIKSRIHYFPCHSNLFIQLISYIAWIYLLYHLFLSVCSYYADDTPLDPILRNLDFWLQRFSAK